MKKVGLVLILSISLFSSCGEVISSSLSTSSSLEDAVKKYDKVNCGERINNYLISQNNGLPKLNSIGERKMLVVPLIIEGYEENATEDNLSKIEKAFFGNTEDVEYESVSSYYEKSSYGKFKLSGKVTPWLDFDITPELLKEKTQEQYDDYGLYYVVDKIYDWYTSTYDDIDSFDSDKDGFIDSLYIIYSAPNYLLERSLPNTFWALTTSRYDYQNTVSDKVRFSCFSWSSYDFMFQNGGESKIDSHTYIHETGHLLGLKDYYCYNDANLAPMGKVDMMDYDIGDHSAFSKFSLGWVNPYYIDDSGEIELNSLTETGDCLIFKTNNYNNTPFDEYIMMEFITPTNLNKDYVTGLKKYGINTSLKGYIEVGVRITLINALCVDKNDNYSDDSQTMVKYKFSNTGYVGGDYYNMETSMFNLLSTMIPENPNRGHGLFSQTYEATSKDLFKEGDTFSLKRDSIYRNMMPSQTNKYFKEGAGFYQFQVNFIDMNEDKCILEIKNLAN